MEHFWINIWKTFFGLNFWENKFQQTIIEFGKNTLAVTLIFIALVTKLYYRCYQKGKLFFILAVFLCLLCFVSYIPVLNIGSYTSDAIINDRYLYFVRIWLFAIAFLLLYFLNKKLSIIISSLFIIVQCYLVVVCANQFKQGGKLLRAITASLPLQQDQKLMFLNLPYQYKGILLCRYPNSIHHLQYVFAGNEWNTNYCSVAREIIRDSKTNFTITKLNDSTIRVFNYQNRNYYNMDGCNSDFVGNGQFNYTIKEGENAYNLSLQSSLKNATLLFFADYKFQEFNLATDSFMHIK
jgi:hypothetical protein